MKKCAVLLLISILLCCVVGCVNENPDPNGDENPGLSGSGEVILKPNLPENLNFDEKIFTVLSNGNTLDTWIQRDIAVGDICANIVDDAIYDRNTYIEVTYNCTIKNYTEPSSTMNAKITNLNSSGDTTFDIMTPYARTYGVLMQQGYFIDLHDVPSMDLSMPWYDSNAVSSLSIANRLFGVTSSFTVVDKKATVGMVFNKQIWGDYSEGSMYDIVTNNEWDLDKLAQLCALVAGESSGDDKMTPGEDMYGLYYQRDTLSAFINSCGLLFYTKDQNDLPDLTLFNNERGITIIDKIFDILYDQSICVNTMAAWTDWEGNMLQGFMQDKVLFMWIRMADIENLKSMESPFGILPCPKYDSNQSEYISSVNPYVCPIIVIPTTNEDSEETGYFIEAISAKSHEVVYPAYCEVLLKDRLTQDNESRGMLNIIFNNRIFDLGQIYDCSNVSGTLIYKTMTYDRDVSSYYAGVKRAVGRAIETMNNNILQIG